MFALHLWPLVNLVVLGLIVLFLLLLFVLFPAAIFVVALLEKRRIRPLKPTSGAAAAKITEESQQIVRDAIARGFSSMGTFSDGDAGIKEGIVTLLLSSDRVTLMKRSHTRLNRRCILMTRFANDRWYVTAEVSGTSDLSDLDSNEMLPRASFAGLLLYHRQRVLASGQPPIPFEPGSVVDDLHRHELLRHQLMESAGLARRVRAGENVWVFTARGAARLCSGYLHATRVAKERMELSRIKTVEAELPSARVPMPLPPLQ